MRTVCLLLRVEAARWSKRQNIGYVIVLIIIMISTFCYVRGQMQEEENRKIVLGVAKQDTSAYAGLLMEYFNENEDFLEYVELLEAEKPALRKAMQENRLDAYLVIPEHFAESMLDMEHLPIRAYVSMKNPVKALALRYAMEAYETYIEAVEVNCTALYRRMREEGFSRQEIDAANMEISLELIFTALGKDDFFHKQILPSLDGESKTALPLAEHYRYTILYFLLLFLFLPAGLRILSFRQTGMMARFRTMPMSGIGVFAATGIPYLLVSGVILSFVCSLQSKMEVLGAAMLLVFPWLAVFLFLGTVCKTKEQYLFVCSMGLVCLAVLGGSLVPEQFLPDLFQEVAHFLPNRNFTLVMGGVTS